MKAHSPAIASTTVVSKTIEVNGLNIFYREAGNPKAPQVLLRQDIQTPSHQYRNLIPALAERFHVLAPDYPGFGNSDMPDPKTYSYTFDTTAEVVEALLEKL